MSSGRRSADRSPCQDQIEQRSYTYGQPGMGHGYHEGLGDGARQGGVVGSLVTIGVGAVIDGVDRHPHTAVSTWSRVYEMRRRIASLIETLSPCRAGGGEF